MSTCLVTGGGGFLGLAIVKKLLARGDKVKVLSRSHHDSLNGLNVEFTAADITNAAAVAQACQGCDIVFHVASKAGIWGPDREYEAVNIAGCHNVLMGCRTHKVPILVYTSTPSVIYHPQAKIENIQEDIPYPTQFECAYARTKAAAEREVLSANCAELATVAIRPHLIYGPGDPNLIPRVLKRAKSGQLPQVGDGTNKVDITYIDNAAQAHLLAAEHIQEAAGKAYFISDGSPVVLWDWIAELLRLVNVPPLKRKLSLGTTRAIGVVLEGVYKVLRIKTEPKMTRFTAQQLATSHYFNISNAKRDLRYEPEVSGAEGLQRLAEWVNATGIDNL